MFLILVYSATIILYLHVYVHVCISHCVLGLGKASQGISTALLVEKTSKRGGKIVNIAAEQGIETVYCILHVP